MKKFFTGFILTLLVIVILYVGAIFFFLRQAHTQPAEIKAEFESEEHVLRVLMMGVDNAETSGESIRTDTLMVLQMDYETGKVSLLSIPRDSYVYIVGADYFDKINHAYALGGAETTRATVENLLGVDIPYYLVIGYDMAVELVDLIGGVEVEVPIDMVYEDPTADPPLYINLEQGEQILDGKKSLQFLRFRSGYGDQDLGRVKSQQLFVKSFIKQMMKPVNILKAPLLVKVYTEHVVTNIPISKVIKFGTKFNSYDLENMTIATIPGEVTGRNNISYYDVYYEELYQLANELFQ